MSWRNRIVGEGTVPAGELLDHPANFRRHGDAQRTALGGALAELGWIQRVVVNRRSGRIIDGHLRADIARAAGAEVPVIYVDLSEDEERVALATLDPIAALAETDQAAFDELLASLQVDHEGLAAMLADLHSAAAGPEQADAPSLADRFGAAPFSVLNAREGWWQQRKDAWLSIGIRSELGRDAKVFASEGATDEVSLKILALSDGISIFDPVLCELVYRWFSPPGGLVLDPFAGGSVRGIVAARLGRQYFGVELRAEQVEANREQAAVLCPDGPRWEQGNSRRLDEIAVGIHADMVFSCPPYADLEVYSDDPDDLSRMPYPDFLAAYREIIAKACARLRRDRFACFVVGEVRDQSGAYRDFVGDTVQAFRDAGLDYYNEAILVTPAGSLPIRAGRAFESTRKLGKTHQNVLVFVKGDPRRATAAVGPVDFDAGMDEATPPATAVAPPPAPRRERHRRRVTKTPRPKVA